MEKQSRTPETTSRVLLVLPRVEEAEWLRQRWAAREPRFHLLTVSTLEQAIPYLADGHAAAVVCDVSAVPAEASLAVLFRGDPARRVPVILLIPPGLEERAAPLLTEGLADCVLKAGSYDVLLAASIRRLLTTRRGESLVGAASPASRSPVPLDFEELKMILRHEINNPLTGILGNAELALTERPELPPAVCRRLETIVDLAVRLRDLVRNLEKTLTERSRPQANLQAPPGRVVEAR